MRLALTLALVVACSAPAAAVAPVETPAPSRTSATRAPRMIAVQIVSRGADDLAASLAVDLPSAWTAATMGLGVARVSADGVLVEVFDGFGTARTGGNPTHVTLYRARRDPGRTDVPTTIWTLMHELGHVSGCCFDGNTANGHFLGEPVGLMTEPTRCDCAFTDRELRAIRLLP